jgi:hypothetical protein
MEGPRGTRTVLEGGGDIDPDSSHTTLPGMGRIFPAGVNPEFDEREYDDPELRVVEEEGF